MTRIFLQEDLNFLLTNRIPRRYATLFMGWFSRIESPTLAKISIAIWKFFADDLTLEEAKRSEFSSLHDCFIRELREGARPVDPDPDVVVSPCDAVVGAFGRVRGNEIIQAKGSPYRTDELLGDPALAEAHEGDWFVTLRLKSNMYHRFHAPTDARVRRVTYFSGDTWNVNPIALRRVERLFVKNERAVLELETTIGAVTMVPVAAILVAGIRLYCIGEALDLRYRGPNRFHCDVNCVKGEELGFFNSGSTIILFAPGALFLASGVVEGTIIRMGQPLFRGARLDQENSCQTPANTAARPSSKS